MSVAVCVADGLMAHALGDVERGEAHIDELALEDVHHGEQVCLRTLDLTFVS
jgi:hypothetical protein